MRTTNTVVREIAEELGACPKTVRKRIAQFGYSITEVNEDAFKRTVVEASLDFEKFKDFVQEFTNLKVCGGENV